MRAHKNPIEIARETLLSLTAKRIPPTPENYRTTYNEIAGQVSEANEAFTVEQLKTLIAGLPQTTPDQLRFNRELNEAAQAKDWERFQKNLLERVNSLTELQSLSWTELLSDLFRFWGSRSTALTSSQKRDSLTHVLNATQNPSLLFTRLQNLSKAWSDASSGEVSTPEETPEFLTQTAILPITAPKAGVAQTPNLNSDFRELLAFTLERCITPVLAEHPRLAKDSTALAEQIRKAVLPKDITDIQTRLTRLAFKLELNTEDQAELRSSLLKLIRLIVENVNELVIDDKWLYGQVEIVREIVEKPLSQRTIDDAQRRLKEVIFKQGQLKHSLQDAKEALKHMLAGFVDHLADFAGTTSNYHDRIEGFAQRISSSNNINELDAVLTEVLQETRNVQVKTLHSRDELQQAQNKVQEAEARIQVLEKELQTTSQLVRNDQLTGALNRRGLEEVFEKEIARANRHQVPICLGLLDIDNFKRLNDSLGHDAGDAALVHLTTVIKETLRPQDTLARYGGEEFIVLLPESHLEQGTKAMTRIQRELTRRIFLHDNRKLLITFSAGVTQMRGDDTQTSIIKRADDAMYQAKQAGKNKVISVP